VAPSVRDRISVDLRGLKAALFTRAKARGVSPSGLVRDVLVEALGQSDPIDQEQIAKGEPFTPADRVRISLRMSRHEAFAALAAARNAAVSPGAFVAGLVAGVPAFQAGANRADHIAALVASSAELSTFSRNIHQLSAHLGQGNVEPALAYRAMLGTLAGDVRGHLMVASRVLADLRPSPRQASASKSTAS
jgi:hypothetical protein